MAQAQPRSNFLQTILIVALVYFTFQLVFPSNTSGAIDYFGKRIEKTAELEAALRDANAKQYDISGQRVYQAYQRALDKDVAAKALTADAAEVRKIEGAILLADTQLKAGLTRNDTGRVRAAYQTLLAYHNRLLNDEMWTKPYPVMDVSADSRFGWREWSGAALYQRTVDEISKRGRTDLIWGFIPGGYAFVDFLVQLSGGDRNPSVSYALAALMLAIIVRLIVFPLAQKQLMFGRQMSQLTPLINDIKAKYKDPQDQQRKTMELYSEYGINPAQGCLPALVQLPLFLTVYQCMTLYQFEFQKGTFLWVNPQTSKAFPPNFVAPNLGQLDPALIIIYGVFMMISTLLQPVTDPSTAKQQRLMGIVIAVFFTVTMFFGWFPVPGAFVLYWIFLLMLSTAQSLWAYRLPIPPLNRVNTAAGGVYPTGFGGKWAKRMQELMEQAEAQRSGQASTPNGGTQKPKAKTVEPISTGEVKTGTPQKHKPKKRK
jgi:YidC/Oxa1 family membrane protein insertase